MPFDAGLDETDTRSRDLIMLEKAQEAIVSRGWQGDVGYFEDERGRLCVLGALCVARGLSLDETAYYYLRYEAQLLGFDGVVTAYEWNDEECASQAEVLARFDTAIRTLTQAPRRCGSEGEELEVVRCSGNY